jgi:hypothetical protein
LSSRPRRRRWTIGLGAFMVLIGMIAVVLELFLGPIRAQKRAVAWAARHDGYVEYVGPEAPAWAVNLLGGEPFQRVVLMEFHFLTAPRPGARRVDDGGLAYLRRLDHLKHLNLRSTRITDRGLDTVAGLHRLQWLNLAYTSVTNAGLARLANLNELQCLDLHSARQVSDDGLVHLKGMAKLAELDLRDNPRITDAGLEPLRAMSSLRVLDLKGTAVTDQGVDRLRRALPNLDVRR